MKLVYSPQARNDIKGIKDYISKELANPIASDRIVKSILKSCSDLKDYPEMGAELKNKFDVDLDYRYLVTSNYIAFYRIDNGTVKVIRILDGRTNYMKYLFEKI